MGDNKTPPSFENILQGYQMMISIFDLGRLVEAKKVNKDTDIQEIVGYINETLISLKIPPVQTDPLFPLIILLKGFDLFQERKGDG